MKRLELALEKKCIAYAKSCGFLAHKLRFRGQSGAPDCLFISKCGECIFVEFKRAAQSRCAEGQLSALQEVILRDYASRNIAVTVCKDFEHFKTIIDACNRVNEHEIRTHDSTVESG